MKKTLLIMSVIMGLSMSAFSQMVFTTTSVTYTGNGQTPAGTNGTFYNYQPNAGSTTAFTDNACSVAGTSSGAGAIGGFDPAFYDLSTATPAIPGATTYGGKLRTTYTSSGSPAVCGGASPSFGFDFNNSSGASTTVVDLSLAANQTLKFTYVNTAQAAGNDFNVAIQLYNRAYTGKLNNLPFIFLADGVAHTATIDLSSYVPVGAVLTDIFQVSFVYVSDAQSPNFGISLSNITLGGTATTTATLAAQSSIASTKLYPNPVSDQANIELNLVTPSDVKVTLSDVMGREVMTIAQGSMSSVTQSFSVANLQKGIYTVNYFVNGAATKAELLMVK